MDIAPRLQVTANDLGRGMVFFPVVGLVLGSALYLVDSILALHVAPGLLGGIECAILAFLTRGLHLDGLADTADGILSGKPREKALSIMKDSSTGALGAVTLTTIILLKAMALGEISSSGSRAWFLIGPMLARNGLVVLAAFSRYARETGGLGSYFCGKIAQKALLPASFISLAASWMLGGVRGVFAWLLILILGYLASMWFKRRLGGVTGDCLGAHLEVTETLVLIMASIKS